jgi:hypothetical protein
MQTIQERFEAFHKTHPEVYAAVVAFSLSVKSKGFKKYAIGAIWERVRWHFAVDSDNSVQLNDHFRSRYARLVMESEPALLGFFQIRELRAE